MKIESITCGLIMVNCYLIYNEGSTDGIVIDPGHGAETIAAWVNSKGISDILIVLTHGHFDHTNAADELGNIFGAKILMNQADEFLLDCSGDEMARTWGYIGTKPNIDGSLEDGDDLEYGGMKLSVIHTPGHSPGSICLYCNTPEKPILISGDTLFNLGIGRTDLPGGSWRELLDNIVKKLWPLPNDTLVYPGHGPETTLGFEKQHNPFLNDVS